MKSLREHDAAHAAVEILLASIVPDELRKAFALLEGNRDCLFTAMLRERVGAYCPGMGALWEHERLRVMVENRRRAETEEPRVRCSWQDEAEGALFAPQPAILD